MEQINITSLKRFEENGYAEVSYLMRFTLPQPLGGTTSPIKGLDSIAESHGFSVEIIEPEIATQPKSYFLLKTETETFVSATTLNQIKNKLVSKYNNIRSKLDSMTIKPYDSIAALSWDGTTWS